MQEVATIHTVDLDSGSDALAIVRAGKGAVAVALSLMDNGDTEIVFALKESKDLLHALQQAIAIAEAP
jgi:hypothetical protein